MKKYIKSLILLFLFIVNGNIKSNAQMVFGPCGIACSFEAHCYCDSIKISWSTLYEIDCDYYTIVRSSDGVYWETINNSVDIVTASQGNYINTRQYYELIDHSPLSGVTYYRLKQTNHNGEFTYSEPISINCNPKEACGDIFVPNAFSPNADGENDELFVLGHEKHISNLIFVIYDRWGAVVFKSDNIMNGWDGKHEEKELETGVYVYWLEAILDNGDHVERKGTIALIR
jgi:gliding motility-associated-like protein